MVVQGLKTKKIENTNKKVEKKQENNRGRNELRKIVNQPRLKGKTKIKTKVTVQSLEAKEVLKKNKILKLQIEIQLNTNQKVMKG